MQKIEIVLKNETGLHARPASLFVKEAAKFTAELKVKKGEKEYNGKSIIDILSMGAAKGDLLTIMADGEDEKEVVIALKELIERNFDE